MTYCQIATVADPSPLLLLNTLICIQSLYKWWLSWTAQFSYCWLWAQIIPWQSQMVSSDFSQMAVENLSIPDDFPINLLLRWVSQPAWLQLPSMAKRSWREVQANSPVPNGSEHVFRWNLRVGPVMFTSETRGKCWKMWTKPVTNMEKYRKLWVYFNEYGKYGQIMINPSYVWATRL